MRVLVVGYGRVGKIKAMLWRDLGCSVVVLESNVVRRSLAADQGFSLFNSLTRKACIFEFVDVCTPNGTHVQALIHCLDALAKFPRTILVEKPLASSASELAVLAEFLKERPHVKHSIVLSESYVLSTGVTRFCEMVLNAGNAEVRIDLSKNRLVDVHAGRFVDGFIGAFGIELPHGLAVAQMLGIAPDMRSVTDVRVFRRGRGSNDSGLLIRLRNPQINLEIASFLGSFVMEGRRVRAATGASIRVLSAEAALGDFRVDLDPAPGCPRYTAKVVNVAGPALMLDDNHLRKLLLLVRDGEVGDGVQDLLCYENARRLAMWGINLSQLDAVTRL